MPPAIMLPSSSLATWPPTNTNPPALVAAERGRVRVPGLRSAKDSIVIWGASANNHASLLRRRRYTVQPSWPQSCHGPVVGPRSFESAGGRTRAIQWGSQFDPLLPVVLSRSGRSLTSLKGCARSLDRLLNYVVRSREHRGGDREAHGFRGPQIN